MPVIQHRRNIVFKKYLISFVVLTMLSASSSYSQSNFVGKWLGELNVQGMTIRVVFNINESDDKILSATLDSPDQSAFGIKVDEVDVADTRIKMLVKVIGASFEGQLNEADIIDGVFKQGGMSLALTLSKTNEVKEKLKPQDPAKPYPYTEEEVVFDNSEAGVSLSGTLTYPKTGSAFPAVILVSGSGPQDRNESLLGHRPFLVLSDYLTKLGFAVLRYDDRGVAKSTGNYSLANTFDFTQDALAAVKYLGTRKEIKKDKIGIIGHSEGGLIAPMAAVSSDEIKFLVLLAGPGTRGDVILYDQGRAINKASGMSDENLNTFETLQRNMFKILMTETDPEKASYLLEELLENEISKFSSSFIKETQLDSSKIGLTIKTINNTWFRTFLSIDPVDYLKKIKIPVLAINGEKDLQVLPKQNLALIEKALKDAGNKDFTVKELKGLNHLFQKCDTCTILEYASLEETFSPEALSVIGDWLKKRFLK